MKNMRRATGGVGRWTRAGGAALLAGALAACGGPAPDGGESAGSTGEAAKAAGAPAEAQAVKSAIRRHVRAEGDTIELEDPTTGEPVRLAFDHLHEDVTATPGGRRVACVDFRGADGTVYDVDVYVSGEAGGFRVEDLVVHRKGERDVIPDSVRAALEAEG